MPALSVPPASPHADFRGECLRGRARDPRDPSAAAAQALGLKPREAPDLERQLDRGDMHKLLQRTGSGGADEADHVKGVGFAGCGPAV